MLKNSFWLFLSNISRLLSGIVIAILIGRMMGPAVLGVYSYSYAVSIILSVFLNLGFPTLIVRDVAADNYLHDHYFRHIFVVKILLLFLVVLAIFLYAAFFVKTYVSLFIWINIACCIYSFSAFLFMFMRSRQDMMAEGLSGFIVYIGSTIMLLFIFLTLGVSIQSLIFVIIIREVVRLGYASYMYLRRFGKVIIWHNMDSKNAIALSIKSLTFAENDLLEMVNGQIDTVMLGLTQLPSVVGFYSAALKIVTPIRAIVYSISQASLPKFMQLSKSNKDDLIRLFYSIIRWVLVSITLLAVIFVFGAPFIINVLFGSGFAISVNVLRLFAFFLPIIVLSPLFSVFMYAIHAEGDVFKVRLSAVICNILLNSILIPHLSLYGAGISMIATAAFSLSLVFYIIKHRLNIQPRLL